MVAAAAAVLEGIVVARGNDIVSETILAIVVMAAGMIQETAEEEMIQEIDIVVGMIQEIDSIREIFPKIVRKVVVGKTPFGHSRAIMIKKDELSPEMTRGKEIEETLCKNKLQGKFQG
jgi:protein-tyrosine-phosphatase